MYNKRDYRLVIGLGSDAVEIRPPFNISFSGLESIQNRNLNKMNVTIYGLKSATRQRLIKYELDRSVYIPMYLDIGYEGLLYQAFKGSVRVGKMSREGASFKVEIECKDGGFDYLNSYTSRVVEGRDNAIDAVLEDMNNTGKGSITTLEQTTRPKVLVGASSDLLSTIAQGRDFYIKDEKIHIMNDDEVVSRVAPLISARTGLLNTPEQDHIDTTFTTLMNPTVKIGGLINLESQTNPELNGVYKVREIQTNGEYDGNSWYQTMTCRPARNYKVVK